MAEEMQRPKTFRWIRYVFGTSYLWYVVTATNGSTYVIITALWFGITFGIIDWLAEEH